jgi:hypothetical protein
MVKEVIRKGCMSICDEHDSERASARAAERHKNGARDVEREQGKDTHDLVRKRKEKDDYTKNPYPRDPRPYV